MDSPYAPTQPNDPAYRMVKIDAAASDTVDLESGVITRGLLVGTAGAATVTDAFGNKCTLVPLQQGYNPIRIKRLWATGLTAANIWALY